MKPSLSAKGHPKCYKLYLTEVNANRGTRRIITILMCALALNSASASFNGMNVGDVVVLQGMRSHADLWLNGEVCTVTKLIVDDDGHERCHVKISKLNYCSLSPYLEEEDHLAILSTNMRLLDVEEKGIEIRHNGKMWNLVPLKDNKHLPCAILLHSFTRQEMNGLIVSHNTTLDLLRNNVMYVGAGGHCVTKDALRDHAMRLVLVPKHRRMAQREFSSRRDSPVMLRLLTEIKETHERYQRKR